MKWTVAAKENKFHSSLSRNESLFFSFDPPKKENQIRREASSRSCPIFHNQNSHLLSTSDIKDSSNNCEAWVCQMWGFMGNFLVVCSNVVSAGTPDWSSRLTHGDVHKGRHRADIIQRTNNKCTTDSSLKRFWNGSSREMSALNARFWCTDGCEPHRNTLPIIVSGLTAQNPGFSCRQLNASLFDVARVPLSKPLVALGEPHLIDMEAPWPAPFDWVQSLQVFAGHYFLTLDLWVCAIVTDRSFVPNIRWFIYVVLQVEGEMTVPLLTFGFLRILLKSDVCVYAIEALSWLLLWVHAESICESEAGVRSWRWPCPDACRGVQGKHQGSQLQKRCEHLAMCDVPSLQRGVSCAFLCWCFQEQQGVPWKPPPQTISARGKT